MLENKFERSDYGIVEFTISMTYLQPKEIISCQQCYTFLRLRLETYTLHKTAMRNAKRLTIQITICNDYYFCVVCTFDDVYALLCVRSTKHVLLLTN